MEDIDASLKSSLSGSTDGVRNSFPKALCQKYTEQRSRPTSIATYGFV